MQRQFYVSADVQPPLLFRYTLSGREARNEVLMGRGTQEQISTARWDADTLVITTRHGDGSGDNGRSVTSEVRHRLSLRPGMFEAHAPLLVIETTRLGILGRGLVHDAHRPHGWRADRTLTAVPPFRG